LDADGGIAFAFAQNWNSFAECRYTRYGSSTITLPFSQVSTTSKTDVSEIDSGMNYKFTWGAPANREYTSAINNAGVITGQGQGCLPPLMLTIGPASIPASTAAAVGQIRAAT
jgi:hypothetical protein